MFLLIIKGLINYFRFLRSSPALRGWTYCNNLYQADIRKQFGLFNLVTIDLQKSESGQQQERQTLPESSSSSLKASFDVTYFTNGSESGPRTLSNEGESQFYAFGNSVYDSPFCKVTDGCREFEEIINSHINSDPATREGNETLKGNLLKFLKSATKHYPDAQIDKQARDAGIINPVSELTSVFVTTPEKANYGTRTHTIIIIDSADDVNYHEWTMEEPINIKSPNWIESQYNFKLTK
ncbi:Transport and Golgi organization protein 2 [Folsomia candida]|uniref:Transport and Golgi organization protein 2 n=1 Tax=Folsomia candida TaxID=158441 RepID=A0A226EM71_FOLCA|nr:Transport and Golgi organization protein 2 [Folsomia candida]